MSEKQSGGILQTAEWNVRQSARRLSIDERMLERILEPREKIEVSLHPFLSDGKFLYIRAYVVRHNDTLGPAKGGIRMTPTVTLDEIAGLSMEMTWKTALIGVPFGGGKSGICCDPSKISAQDKEIIIRAFTRAVCRHIGPEIYVPAPDMGTNEKDMGHIRDCIAYSLGTSITDGCFVTGKPVVLGGIIGRKESTGQGVVHTIAAACERLGLKMSNLRVAVQGFGNVGGVAAAKIIKTGATVVAVSDVSGGTADVKGLDVEKLQEHVKATGGVKGFTGGSDVPRDSVLEADCDVLIPAAGGSSITEANAGKIRARMIAEGANAPVTPQADEILQKREIFVIPDILCNAGGVFVSYLEYTQEMQREQMTYAEVDARLTERMRKTFNDVYERAQQQKCPMRWSAIDIAVLRVVEGINARGLLP